MKEIVTFYADQEGWLHAYGTDAVVISNIVGYQLYNRYTGDIAIGFPIESLKKVTNALSYYKIGYAIEDVIIEKYNNSEYLQCLKSEYVKEHKVFSETKKYITKTEISGTFTIQYNDEEPITRTIGKDINPEAKIVEIVARNDEGTIVDIEEDKVRIIKKLLTIKNVVVN